MLSRLKSSLGDQVDYWRLPGVARKAAGDDRAGRSVHDDPGAAAIISAGLAWLCRAQDSSLSNDGGVARDYSLVKGWAASYPETTGYIVPTLLEHGERQGLPDLTARARRMLDWLVSIQFPEGGFQGGVIGALPRVPVTFNTGQILLGLAAGAQRFGAVYDKPMRLAADWLSTTLDPDGCWRKHATPFAAPGEKAYETHVAWGLLEAARVAPDAGYARAALKNIRWAITHQQPNGWMAKCCLSDPEAPLTHTLGYALRGILEGHRLSKDADLLASGIRLADGLASALGEDGFLPGRLRADWSAAVPWACLTGISQTVSCWLYLCEATGSDKYKAAARRANAYVRRRIDLDGPPEVRGAVKGSFPVDGGYCRFEYPNWATKFTIDAQQKELDLFG